MRPGRRLAVLYAATVVSLAVVWMRVGWLQLVARAEAVADARRMRERDADVPAGRGRIEDAAGEALAVDRAAVRLLFCAGEWASRARWKCGKCGAVHARREPRWWGASENRPATPPARCSCGARRDALVPLPAEDLAPLEDAIGLPPGTLAGAAADRMTEVRETIEAEVVQGVLGLAPTTLRTQQRTRRIERGRPVPMEEVVATYRDELEGREFYAEDLRMQRRADHYGRATPMMTFRTPDGGRLDLRTLPAAAERLLELDREGRYRGFRTGTFTERWYPRHGLLAHAVGVVTPPGSDAEVAAYRARVGRDVRVADVRVGRIGLEATYEAVLQGVPGRVRAERDDEGLFTRQTVVEPPRRGEDLVLHLRASACDVAYRALVEAATPEAFAGDGPPSAAFVMLDAETGAVLAWAETPVFDPNGRLDEITTRIDEDEALEREVVSRRPPPGAPLDGPEVPRPGLMLSRVARLPVEPGSTMKLVSAFALLASGHPLPTEYHCAGRDAHVVPSTPRCHPHDPVDVVGALAHSCNRWFADGASDPEHRALHAELFPTWAARFGIGDRPGLDWVGAARGAYPKAPDGPLLRMIAIGQSVLATPVQMARVAAAVGNGRTLPEPRLVATVGGRPVGTAGEPLGCDPRAVELVRAGMRGCVRYGTAKHAFVELEASGVTVHGKSGTATVGAKDWLDGDEDWVERGEDGRTRARGPWHLWFVGYASKPGARTVAFATLLHSRREGAGGDAAARVAARVLAAWFGS